MSPLRLAGVFGPVITTFSPRSGDVDLEALARNARAHVATGFAGLVVCGSTGEAALLTEDERRLVLESARREVPTDRLLLMGTGAESTRVTVERCQQAKASGADAVLVVAPHYYSAAMTHEALRAHYHRVADESPLPVLLYNIPKYMHFKLSPELVAELARHENIVGIKDSSGDLELLAGYLRAQSDSFTVITGNGGQLHPALMAGARAGILAVALFAGHHAVQIYKLYASGDHAAAERLQAELRPLAVTIVAELGVPGVKSAMDACGLAGGPVRSPLLDLDDVGRARVASLMVGLGAAA